MIADEYLPIRPGTDVYLLLSLLKEIFAPGVADIGHSARRSTASRRCATRSARSMRSSWRRAPEFLPCALRRWRARSRPSRARWSMDGSAPARRNSADSRCGSLLSEPGHGALDAEGGMMFAEPAVDLTRAYGSSGHYDRFRSRVRGCPNSAMNCRSRRWRRRSRPEVRDRSARCSRSPATPCCPRRTAGNWIAHSRPRFHGVGGSVPERDDAAREPDPAADQPARARALRRRIVAASRCATSPSTRPRCSRRRRARCTIMRSWPNSRCGCERRPGCRESRAAMRGRLRVASGLTACIDWMLRTGRYGQENRGSLRLLAGCRDSTPCVVSSSAPDRRPED